MAEPEQPGRSCGNYLPFVFSPESFFQSSEFLITVYFPEALLSQCESTSHPQFCLIGFLSPAANPTDVAAQIFDGIFDAVCAEECFVQRRGHFQALEGNEFIAGFREAVTSLLVLLGKECANILTGNFCGFTALGSPQTLE